MASQLHEQLFQVGDLGRFSMRAIYDALVATEHSSVFSGQDKTARRPSHQHHVRPERDPEDSDCSWTQEDVDGTFYFDMQRRLDEFVKSASRATMTTASLSKPQRRFVHATAQIMRLGHASLGPQARFRSMIIFKDPNASVLTFSSAPRANEVVYPIAGEDSPVSAGNKRRRLERVENGFPCHYCEKVFDRASERKKHEQAHQATFTNRFQCPVCGKGFRYPKDLRRHGKIHNKQAGTGSQSLASSFEGAPLEPKELRRYNTVQDKQAGTGFQSLASSFEGPSLEPKGPRRHGNVDDKVGGTGFQSLASSFEGPPLEPTLTASSRVPSDLSLTFSSNTVSKDVSPLLLGQNGEQNLGFDIEPLVLDDSAWLAGPMGSLDDWLYDPPSGMNDEDFLEMAKVRK